MTTFLLILFVWLAAVASGKLCEQIKLPALFGQLTIGILLGPSLGLCFAPTGYFALSPETLKAFSSHAKEALAIFLLAAGMELNIRKCTSEISTVLRTGVSGLLFPFILGYLCFPYLLPASDSNSTLAAQIFFAVVLSISALPVIAKIMIDLGLYQTRLSAIVMASAIFDDLIGWFMVILCLELHKTSTLDSSAHIAFAIASVALAILVILLPLRYCANRFADKCCKSPTTQVLFILSVLYSVFWLAPLSGLHAPLACFLVGLTFSSQAWILPKTHAFLKVIGNYFSAPLFFASIGISINLAQAGDFSLTIGVLIIACIGKIIGAGFGAYMSKLPAAESLSIGFAMNARGAVGIVIAKLGYEVGLISESLLVALIVMAVITSLLAALTLKALNRNSSAERATTPLLPQEHLPQV